MTAKYLKIFVFLLCFIVLGIAVFYFWDKNKKLDIINSPLEHKLNSSSSTSVSIVIRKFLSDAPAMIADELNYYADEGLNMRSILVDSGSSAWPLISSGDVQFAILGNKYTIISQSKNTDVKEVEIIANLGGGGDRWRVMVGIDSEINSIYDLNGKKMGTWLDSYGYAKLVDYLNNKKIKIIPVQLNGMIPQVSMAVLKENSVDAVLVWEPIPTFLIKNNAGKQLFDFGDDGDEMFSYLHARRDFIDKNFDLTVSVLKALEMGVRFIDNNPEEASVIISKRIDLPPEIIREAIKNINFGIFLNENEGERILNTLKYFNEAKVNDFPDAININDKYIKELKNQ